MKWCAKATRMHVRTNADSPEQAANAIAFGATGIGLCRTEHMFFEGNRIDAMREMILAENIEDRKKALAKLLPYQRDDFVGIFTRAEGLPGHHPLPRPAACTNSCRTKTRRRTDLADKMGVPVEKIAQRVARAARVQPDARPSAAAAWASSIPEITEMQARAVFEAAAEVQKEGHQGQAGDHDPARRLPEGIAICRLEVVHRVAAEVGRRKRRPSSTISSAP